MRLPRLAKKLIRSSVVLTCAAYMADDWLSGRRLAAGRIETNAGTKHTDLDLQGSLDYIEMVYRDYLSYAGVETTQGTVAEIGPGDNFGVALMLLWGGAESVHAIDRYYSRRDPIQQRLIYQALSDRFDLKHYFDGEPSEEAIRGLAYHAGEAAETFFATSGIAFDAIVSRAVMEHLYDPLSALDDMLQALKPGGFLAHRIDFRDHGMFPGRNPLTFLTVPEGVYTRMTRNSGRPNRVLLPQYRDWAARSGAQTRLLVSRLAGIEDDFPPVAWDELDGRLRARAEATVRKVRPRLAGRFRGLPDCDLAVAGCVLVAHKPGLEGA